MSGHRTELIMIQLTHTPRGGLLDDVSDLPPVVPDCYGWLCIQELKNPKNAGNGSNSYDLDKQLIFMIENVAMFGLALHLWSIGYYVDKEGNVHNK
jgi:hypothetical protein